MTPGRVALAVVVALSRLPFLGAGYGSDMDAWSVAYTARWIAEHGQYGVSRFPGHPVQELTCALLWRGGPWALNGASALMSVAAAVLFARLLAALGSRDAWLGGLALAFTPVVFIHSTDAMDFVWSLPFLIAAIHDAHAGRPARAGAWLGVAIGCRITAAALLPTLALLLAGRGGPPRAIVGRLAALTLAAAAVAAIVLAPVIARFGSSFLRIYESPHPGWGLDAVKNGTLEVWGVIGGLGLMASAVGAWWTRRRGPPMPPRLPRHQLAAWLIALVAFGAGFARLPFDAGYLVPAVPVTLVLAARLLDRPGFAFLCVCLVAAPFLIEVAEVGRPDSPARSPLALSLAIRGRPVVVDLLQGPLPWDQARRRAQMRQAERIRRASDALAGEVVVITDGWTSWLQVDHRAARAPGDRFVHGLDAARAAELRRRGVRLYFVPEAQWNYRAWHGVGLESLGAMPLPGLAPDPASGS